MGTKNITVKISEEVYDRARMVAARRRTSISNLVRVYLEDLEDQDEQREQQRVEALKHLWALRDGDRSKVQKGETVSFSREETYVERILQVNNPFLRNGAD